ncbi:hypothetical protein DL546_007035 [Coniochaeta pulveracea]|uniref:Uncharacterized protein n=1 Tax=Coniochaeta pulveracea TaxID=177199 RepID=A0A420YC02_9PEZI|nr:hypothetical protein DL546_007035 [Coniochaeta pulveracea]
MSQPTYPQITFPDMPTGTMPSPVEPHYPGLPSTNDEGVRMMPLPGVRCPTCAANGQEVWVIPGRACSNCGTPCC